MFAALRGLRAALTFLTRVPVGGFPYRDSEWRWTAGWFPTVGALLGLLYAALFSALAPAGAFVAATLVVAATLLVTGAFHEDGLADTADAMGGAYDREKLFLILKDSRIGAFGAAALIVVVLLRVTLLAQLSTARPHQVLFALVAGEALSRLAPVWLMTALPYVTPDAARSKPVAHAGPAQALLASLSTLALLAAFVATGHASLRTISFLLATTLVASLILGQRFHARAGGVTGDFLGASQQITLCTLWLTLLLTP